MDARELDQLKKLEAEVLRREVSPAKPVGLRYDRLAREGWLPATGGVEVTGSPGWPGSSGLAGDSRGAYWRCNCLAVSALLRSSPRVLVACEESWAGELPLAAGVGASVPSTGPFDAVLADSSVLLSGELRETLSGFRRVLDKGGRVVLLVASWEYEMEGESVRYDLSFKRYRGKVYAGLVKRTLEPALEVEYVCLLDPDAPSVRDMAELPRDRLRLMGIRDLPEMTRLVIAAEVIKIPQATVRSLEAAGGEAGYSRSVVAGAPGILAARLSDALPETSSGPRDDVHRALASSFPFVSAAGSPHLLAVFVAA